VPELYAIPLCDLIDCVSPPTKAPLFCHVDAMSYARHSRMQTYPHPKVAEIAKKNRRFLEKLMYGDESVRLPDEDGDADVRGAGVRESGNVHE
jgi:hypothetical protein